MTCARAARPLRLLSIPVHRLGYLGLFKPGRSLSSLGGWRHRHRFALSALLAHSAVHRLPALSAEPATSLERLPAPGAEAAAFRVRIHDRSASRAEPRIVF